jgi:cobalt-zinc-cadmium efflux system protein
MAHAHDGNHDAQTAVGRLFAIGVALNVGFVILEALYGWRAGSLALLADAFHNLSDVGGLLLAWAGLAAGRLAPNERHTYGWRRGSILASFGNAVLLLVSIGSLAWEAAHRLGTPVAIGGWTVVIVAAIGVVVNATTAALFFHGRKSDLNIRAAFLHMAADALVSLGVVAAGVIYLWQAWMWIDPVASLVIAAAIVAGTWSLFKESLHLLFDGVPEGIDVREALYVARPARCAGTTRAACLGNGHLGDGAYCPPRPRRFAGRPGSIAARSDTRAGGTLQDPACHAATRGR